MREIRYVRLDPTGNITCLVLDPVTEAERPRVTAALMDRCEQVGYLEAPTIPGVRARLRMMGGEFCGNASMAAAAWIADRDGAPDGRREIALEVSGAEGPVACAVARAADGSWEGTVEMPLPLEIRECEILGIPLTAVFLPGMVHLIREGRLEPAEAERLLLEAGKRFREPAAGLIQWLEEQETLIPLVWVRESGTLVWETACGSGTEAAACVMSEREGRSLRTAAAQPGGILRAEVRRRGGRIAKVLLCGSVRMAETERLILPEG